MSKVKRISLSLSSELLNEFNELITEKAYISRSKAVSDAIRNYIASSQWKEEKGVKLGVITVLYDHTVRNLTEKITGVQHSFHSSINSTTHLHLDRKNCLELLIVKADSKKINKLATRLQVLKGVSQVKIIKINN